MRLQVPLSNSGTTTPSRTWTVPSPQGVDNPSTTNTNGGSPFLAKNVKHAQETPSSNEKAEAPLPGGFPSGFSKTAPMSDNITPKTTVNKTFFLASRNPTGTTQPQGALNNVSSNSSASSQSTFASRHSKPSTVFASKFEEFEKRATQPTYSIYDGVADVRALPERPKPRFLQRNLAGSSAPTPPVAQTKKEAQASNLEDTRPRFLRKAPTSGMHRSPPSFDKDGDCDDDFSRESSATGISSGLSSGNFSGYARRVLKAAGSVDKDDDDDDVRDELLERLQKEYIAHSEQIQSLQQQLELEKKTSAEKLQQALDDVATLKADLEKEKQRAKDSQNFAETVKKLEKELADAKRHAQDLEDQATEEVERLYNELEKEKKAAKDLEDQATEEVERLYAALEEEKKASAKLETQANEEIERLSCELSDARKFTLKSESNDKRYQSEMTDLKNALDEEIKKSEELEKEKTKMSSKLGREMQRASEIERAKADIIHDLEKERQHASELQNVKDHMSTALERETRKSSDLEKEVERIAAELEDQRRRKQDTDEEVASLKRELDNKTLLLREQEEKSHLIEALKRQTLEQCTKLKSDLEGKDREANQLREKINALNQRCLVLENESKDKETCFYSETARLEEEIDRLKGLLSSREPILAPPVATVPPVTPPQVKDQQKQIASLEDNEKLLIEENTRLKRELEAMSRKMEQCREPEAIGEIKMKFQSIIVDLEREKDDVENALQALQQENNQLKMRIKEESYNVGAEMVKLLMHEELEGTPLSLLEEEFREAFEDHDKRMVETINQKVQARAPMNMTADGKVSVDAEKLGMMKQTLIQLKVANGRTEKQIGFVKGICDQIVESLRQELKDLELEKAEVEKDLLNQITSINSSRTELEDEYRAKLQIKNAEIEELKKGNSKLTPTEKNESTQELQDMIKELQEQKIMFEKEFQKSVRERDEKIQDLTKKIDQLHKSSSGSTNVQTSAQNSAEIQTEMRELKEMLEESQKKIADMRKTTSDQKQIITTISADLKMANEKIEKDKKIRLEKITASVEERMEQINSIYDKASSSMEILENMMKQLKAREDLDEREGVGSTSLRHDRQIAISLFSKATEMREELCTSLNIIQLKLMNRLNDLEEDLRKPAGKQDTEKALEQRDVAATVEEKSLQIREESRSAVRKVERDITRKLNVFEEEMKKQEDIICQLQSKCAENELALREARARNKVSSTSASKKLIDQLDSEVRTAVEKIREKDKAIMGFKVEVEDLQLEIDDIMTEKGGRIQELEKEINSLKSKMKVLEYNNYSFSDDEKEMASTEEENTPDRTKKSDKPSPFYKKVAEKYKETAKTKLGTNVSLGYC